MSDVNNNDKSNSLNVVLEKLSLYEEILWENTSYEPDTDSVPGITGDSGTDGVNTAADPNGAGNSESNSINTAAEPNSAGNLDTESIVDIADAEARLHRFAPFIAKAFPETIDGIIESGLIGIPGMKKKLSEESGIDIKGRLFLKMDCNMPVCGSVKARGGVYEVLKFAETIAQEKGMLKQGDNYRKLDSPEFKELFSNYRVAVGSTGNLGLAVGIIGSALGFQVNVHTSKNARQWKKDLLRSNGVSVMEHDGDYNEAVAIARKESTDDPMCYFIDDENSKDLFAGYSVAGGRLKEYLEENDIIIDDEHKLYVYIPCGVGGAPGGITYGLKHCYGDNVYCFFAEPVHAPSMTLGLSTGLWDKISVQDIGIDGITAADGLAVSRPSGFASAAAEHRVSGCFTVSDDRMYEYLAMLKENEGIYAEPSACAAFAGPGLISGAMKPCNTDKQLYPAPDENSIHIVWATGGILTPDEEKEADYNKGKKIMEDRAEAAAKAAEAGGTQDTVETAAEAAEYESARAYGSDKGLANAGIINSDTTTGTANAADAAETPAARASKATNNAETFTAGQAKAADTESADAAAINSAFAPAGSATGGTLNAVTDTAAGAAAGTEQPVETLTGSDAMEEHVRKTLYENNIEQENSINGMMKSRFKDFSYEDKTLTFVFPVLPWESNRVGNMHGGAICAAFDLAIGALARFYAREYFAPTVSLDVQYIRPIKVGDTLEITARATATGRRITQLNAEAYLGSTGKLAATAQSVYLNVDTHKERIKSNKERGKADKDLADKTKAEEAKNEEKDLE